MPWNEEAGITGAWSGDASTFLQFGAFQPDAFQFDAFQMATAAPWPEGNGSAGSWTEAASTTNSWSTELPATNTWI